MRVDWTSGRAPGIAGRGRRQAATGFALPDASVAAGDAPEMARPAAPPETLQLEPPSIPVANPARSDKEAAKHGQAVLSALADVQVAALGGTGGQALGQLATLLAQAPRADNPKLHELLQAVAARAAVELARAGQ